MSGAFGFLSTSDSTPDREATLRRMADALADPTALPPRIRSVGDCSLGERARAGTPQLDAGQTRDGRYHAVISADLLNLAELRHELHSQGLESAHVTPATVVAHAYGAWGGGFLRRLRGAFALAIWDSEAFSLLLARDPLGQRSLYHVQHRDRFLFATELRALVSSGAFPVAIAPDAVNDCVTYGAPVSPRTLYSGVSSLRPGECLTIQEGRVSRRQFWSFRDVTPTNLPPNAPSAEFLPEFRARFAEVLRAHFTLDARLGCLIDGEIGSTLVAGLAAKLSPAPLRTFSICFADEGYRSEDYAPRVARHFGTRHESRLLGATDVARDLDALLSAYDQPADDLLAAYYLSQSAGAGGLTALLTGTGAGPLFGQSPSPSVSPDQTSTPSPRWQRLLAQFHPQSATASGILRNLLKRGGSLHEVAALRQRIVGETLRQRLLTAPGVFRPHDELENLPREVPDRDPGLVEGAWEIRARLGCSEFPTTNRAAAAHGLRFLAPLLDPGLLSWCRSHPRDAAKASLVDAGGLTSTLGDLLLPDTRIRPQVVNRPPFHLWMRGALRPFMEQTFSDASLSRSSFFQTGTVRQLWQDALADKPTDWPGLWRLAVLIHFVNRRVPAPVLRNA
ncbi:asparagine synthetase B family protein [Nibricoccus sp. IMCC34717]|uniref:asparagine synthetase B family protein n=1 Tax=Nibricoccus sp. IMCC34717 TaxID=3034021 RepID=UPI00384DCCBC